MGKNIELDLSNIPHELLLILEIITMKSNEHSKHIIEKYQDIDWNLFIDLALHHRIYPVLYTKLKKNEKCVPEEILQTLQQYYKRNIFHMLHLAAETEKIAKYFTENEIPTLFLKGPILGTELYGDISLRTSSDIDFLVPIVDIEKAETLLINNGYVKEDYIQTVLNDWTWRHHHFTFIHPDKEIKIEIHWRLHPGPGKEPSFTELWNRKSTSSITGYSINLLGKEDLLLFLITHGARHGWSRIRWLVDIDRIVQHNINWFKINQLFKKFHSINVAGQAFILSNALLHTTISKNMQNIIEGNRPKKLAQNSIFYMERMVNLHTEPLPEEIAEYHKHHLYSMMSIQQKCLYALSTLYPYPSDLETFPLPKNLHILYFPLRPFLAVWRKTRKNTLHEEDRN